MTKEELLNLKEEILKLKDIKDIQKKFPKMTAYSFLKYCNKERMNSVAINYLGRTMTYSELFDRIDTTAKAYSELGVKRGDIVSLGMLMTPEAIISFYALNKIGAISHMINATHNVEEIENDLGKTTSGIFVTNDVLYNKRIADAAERKNINKVIINSLSDSLPYGFYGDKIKFSAINKILRIKNKSIDKSNCINWKDFYKIGENSTKKTQPKFIVDEPIAIAYTSGTTGKPKGVIATNDGINAVPVQLGMTDETFLPNDTIFNSMPIWIYYSLVNNTHNPLCLGVTLNLDPLFNSKQIHKRLKQYKFNHWNTIPSYVEDLVRDTKLKNMDLSFLKSITTGGDFLTPTLKKEAEKKLKDNNSDIYVGQGYGASELLGSFGYTYNKNMSATSVGKPLVGNKYKILDLDTKEELSENQKGELYLYSPAIMKGYFEDEKSSSEVIIMDKNNIKWYKTGDIAHYNDKGELFIDGRIRRIELTRDDRGLPVKVFPDQIRNVILNHSAIEKCEVIMVNDDGILKPVSFIVMKPGYVYDQDVEKEISMICRKNKLENYCIPIEYRVVDNIPQTMGLKTDYDALQEIYEEKKCIQKTKKLKKI